MEKLFVQNKFYVSIRLDREKDAPVIHYSKMGGMTFKKIMNEYPDDMHAIYVDFIRNLRMGELLNVATDLGIESQKSSLTFIIKHLYDLFVERDVTEVELNPLVITKDQQLYVNCTKIKFDRNAEFRQQQLLMQRDWS
jgi:succinyl-CoA synthetase beta subunit